MKSFLQLVEEKEGTSRPVVMAFGRMNPPTTGHLKLIDKVRSTAERLGAKHTVIVSHSQDAKKNPLSGAQKVKHLQRYSKGTKFDASSKKSPTIMHHAAHLHAAGHDHLHVVAGSDRVKEMHELLHKYNGVEGKHGYYNFKKITVHSAGHRDPDAEGEEGMSGTKMREHAKNKDFSSFRQGIPSHVSDNHAKELMKDTRKGMGLNEEMYHGHFRAVFVTGGPGSGKDVIIRECIAESRAVELNFTQAFGYLSDKQKLSESSNDFRKEAIRARGPLIINGPADDIEHLSYIKEELEELGYETMMVFVSTNNETSKERNQRLSRMMVESIRQDKWNKSQINTTRFSEMYENFIVFDNTGNLDTKEEEITEAYQSINGFFASTTINETVEDWLIRNTKLDVNKQIGWLFNENSRKTAKQNQAQTVRKYNTSFQSAKGPADIKPDNSGSVVSGTDQVQGDQGAKKDYKGKSTVTGGAWHGAYESAGPTLTVNPPPKEKNFSLDKDKLKRQKRGDKSLSAGRVGRPDGIGQSYDTRAGGQGAAAGAGLGQNLYGEQDYSNAQISSVAMPGSSSMSPNPLAEKKKKKLTFKEYNGFQNSPESGLGGVLGGGDNKERMDTYKDPNRKIGIEIKKKNNKRFNRSKDDVNI